MFRLYLCTEKDSYKVPSQGHESFCCFQEPGEDLCWLTRWVKGYMVSHVLAGLSVIFQVNLDVNIGLSEGFSGVWGLKQVSYFT